MVARTLVALYHNSQIARAVVDSLLEAGFSSDDITLLVSDSSAEDGSSREISVSECAGLGALVGALVGIGSALVPGIAPALSIGVVGVAVTAGIGAVVGALTGGITAGLIDIAPEESEIQSYANTFARAGTIVCLKTQKDWVEWAEKIMHRYQPIKFEVRGVQEYSSPWLTLAPDGHDSSKFQTISDASSTKLRQFDSSLKLHSGVRIYEYPN